MVQREKIIELINKSIVIFEKAVTTEDKLNCFKILFDLTKKIEPFVTVKTYDKLIIEVNNIIYSNNNLSEDEFSLKFNEVLNLFLEFQDDYINNKTNKIKLSFAIPTARAFYAKIAAEEILKYDGDDIEVVVSHNYLDEMTETDFIEINDSRFKYYKREYEKEYNVLKSFTLNLLNAMEKSSGDYIFILSDKDLIDTRIIKEIIYTIQNNRDISTLFFIRGDRPDEILGQYNIYNKGDIAVSQAYIKFVMTGLIYKKSLIDFEYYYDKVNLAEYGYLAYPHCYLFLDLCRLGNYVEFLDIGHSRPDIEYPNFSKSENECIPSYRFDYYPYSFENRVKTFKDFTNLFIQNIDDESILAKTISFLMSGYYTMTTEFMYLSYPKELWHEIDINKNADIFRNTLRQFFSIVIVNINTLAILNQTSDYFYQEILIKNEELLKKAASL